MAVDMERIRKVHWASQLWEPGELPTKKPTFLYLVLESGCARGAFGIQSRYVEWLCLEGAMYYKTITPNIWQCIKSIQIYMYHKIRAILSLRVNWKASGLELDLCSGGSSQGLWVRGCFQCADATIFRNCLQPINLPRCVLWQTCLKICGLECKRYMFSTYEQFFQKTH